MLKSKIEEIEGFKDLSSYDDNGLQLLLPVLENTDIDDFLTYKIFKKYAIKMIKSAKRMHVRQRNISKELTEFKEEVRNTLETIKDKNNKILDIVEKIKRDRFFNRENLEKFVLYKETLYNKSWYGRILNFLF